MSEFEEECRGVLNLDNTNAGDFLKEVAKIFEQAPKDTQSFVDLEFMDRFEHTRTMRMILLEEEDGGPTIN